MKRKLYWLALLFLLPLSVQALEEGTTIIGTKEAPNVLNVVPWQSRELGVDPWNATPTHDSDLLNESLKPVDRDELQRQVEYFNLLQDSSPQAVEP
ncbi:MAG TPA: hypothetical protein VM553_16885 [Dongiaceae bacterium]|nr:hypothetical protein [Dongiaceae bacterium]